MPADLTQKEVVRLLKTPGTHRVSDNLYLQVRPSGSASWLFRYMHHNQAHWMGLGKYGRCSLKQARKRAQPHAHLLDDGVDPLRVKRKKAADAKLAAAKSMTFKECADQYVAAQQSSWKNDKHTAQWRATFGLNEMTDRSKHAKRKRRSRVPVATAVINDLPVTAIDTALALKVLEPIWSRTPETASRVRQRCEQVIAWATATKCRTGENPFAWRGHLDKLLAKPSKLKKLKGTGHHPSLPFDKLPQFMAELRANKFVSARALEFTILTAARTGEAIGATWDEIDLTKKTWIVPPGRMKAGNEHKVPLSDRTLEILRDLPREHGNQHVFIGGKKGKPLSNMAMLQLMRSMRPGYVPHGFRATFRTWCEERTSYPHIVAELSLAHTQSDALMRAYQRGDLFEKRRRLMLDWAKFCASPSTKETGSSNVTPMRRREKVA